MKLPKDVRIAIVKEAIEVFDERPDFLCTILSKLIKKHIKRVLLYDDDVSLYIPEFNREYVPKRVKTNEVHIVWFQLVRYPTGLYNFNVADRKKYLVRLLKRIEKSVD